MKYFYHSAATTTTTIHWSARLLGGLCLVLLALSVLETVPSSLLQVWISELYTFVFLSLAALIIIFLPYVAGTRIVRILLPDPGTDNLRVPRVFRICWGISNAIFFLGRLILGKCKRRGGRHNTILLMTTTNNTSSKQMQRPTFTQNYREALGGLLSVLLVVASFYTFAPRVVAIRTDGNEPIPFAMLVVSWLCAGGYLVSGMLNGFYAVSTPHSCLVGLGFSPVPIETIKTMRKQLKDLESTLQDRKAQLTSASGLAIRPMAPPSANSFRRSSFNDLGDEVIQRRQALQEEIVFLESLKEDMALDVEEAVEANRLGNLARTPMGRIRVYVGIVFSVLLFARLLGAAISLWNASARDNVSSPRQSIVSRIIRVGVTEKDFDMVSQFVSLLLTAVLSISQLRTCIRTLATVNHRLQSFYGACVGRKTGVALAGTDEYQNNHGIYECVLSSIFSCYIVASVVSTKLMLGSSFELSLGTARRTKFELEPTIAINLVFVLATVISAVTLGILFGIQKQRHNMRQMESDIMRVEP